MNPNWPGSSFTDLQIPWSVTKAPKNAFKPDNSCNRNAGLRVSFSPKSEASYPLFKDLASHWLRISNCSHDLLKYRGCSGPWGCRSVDSLRPPPCNRNTGTAVCKKNIISCFFTQQSFNARKPFFPHSLCFYWKSLLLSWFSTSITSSRLHSSDNNVSSR